MYELSSPSQTSHFQFSKNLKTLCWCRERQYVLSTQPAKLVWRAKPRSLARKCPDLLRLRLRWSLPFSLQKSYFTKIFYKFITEKFCCWVLWPSRLLSIREENKNSPEILHSRKNTVVCRPETPSLLRATPDVCQLWSNKTERIRIVNYLVTL